MNRKILFPILVVSLLVAGCSGLNATAATPTAIPTVPADPSTIAEGRVEPVRYVDIALNSSGLVSEVMSKEGDQLQAGQIIARLQGNNAQTLEEAQANTSQELTTAYQNLRDAQYKLDDFDVPSDFKDQTPTEAVSQTLDQLNTARDLFAPYRFNWNPTYGYLNLDDPHNYPDRVQTRSIRTRWRQRKDWMMPGRRIAKRSSGWVSRRIWRRRRPIWIKRRMTIMPYKILLYPKIPQGCVQPWPMPRCVRRLPARSPI